ncbi:MAG: hypothetical protein WCX79_01905 [Candidatus Paceibacterota bacterium]
MKKKDKFCIHLLNYERIMTIFTKEQRIKKANKHSELRNEEFIFRVIKTITHPSFIYEDLDKENRYSYYLEEFKINSRTMYVKVMLLKKKDYFFIITAYRVDYVKERGKTRLLYGKDEF